MKTIETLCANIEKRLFSDPRFTRDSFFPPLTENEIKKTLDQIGLKPSPELVRLYNWKNGQDHLAFYAGKCLPLFERYFFLPLDVAVERTPKPDELYDWGPAWLPILDDYAGDCIFVDLSPNGKSSVGYYATTSGEPIRGHGEEKSIVELFDEVETYWSLQ